MRAAADKCDLTLRSQEIEFLRAQVDAYVPADKDEEMLVGSISDRLRYAQMAADQRATAAMNEAKAKA